MNGYADYIKNKFNAEEKMKMQKAKFRKYFNSDRKDLSHWLTGIVRCEKCGAMVKVLIDCTCENCGIKCCGETMKEISKEEAEKLLNK